nr:E-beta-farnesene synthase [Tanacetum cinerariifolium]
KMADVNAPSGQAPKMAPPVRTDDQILPSIRAFTASSTIPSIYIQQFWDTVQYDKKARNYKCQLDEQWVTLILIPIIQFTKLIIHYLQRRHKFHPRPDSPLHLPNEEPVLGYLKFSAKGTKREVFEIPIPDNLITANIQGEPYFKEYLEKVTKHQTYLGDEKESAPNSPAPKPAKATKKSKLRTSTSTGSSSHDESSSLYAKLGLTNSEVESDKDVPGIDAGVQEECQVGPNPGEQDEGQVGPNPGEQDKGQAGSNPSDAAVSQPQSSPVVHARPNLEYMDLEATYVSTQPHPE